MSDEQNQNVPPKPDAPPPNNLPPIELVSLNPERLAEPMPNGAPEELLPLPPGLDPDLTLAFQSGNTAVINAIRAGATTSQQVVDRMIQMGFTTGLPPEVQRLVDQRQMEVRERNEAENRRLLETGKEVLTAAAFFTGFNDRGSYGAEKSSKDAETSALYSKPWSEMNDFQRAAFLDGITAMSSQSWLHDLTDKQRMQARENVNDLLQETAAQSKEQQNKFFEEGVRDERFGATPEERLRNMTQARDASARAIQLALQANNKTEADVEKMSKPERDAFYRDEVDTRMREILKQAPDYSQASYTIQVAAAAQFNGIDKAQRDAQAEKTHSTPQQLKTEEAKIAVDQGIVVGQTIQEHNATGQRVEVAAKAAAAELSKAYKEEASGPTSHAAESRAEAKARELDAQKLLRSVVEEAQGSKQAAAYQARTENLSVRQGADGVALSTSANNLSFDTPDQTPRLTVNASTLNGPMLTSLGAPDQPAAPASPLPRPQQKPTQQAGMSA